MERYEDFWEVTRAALRSAVMQLKIEASGAQLDRLMQAYLTPQAFPEVISALDALKGTPMAILFVSSISWDAAGAKAFGYKVCWCNRSQKNMEELGISVNLTVLSLDQIASSLTQGNPRLANEIL
jgi:hypothetical protein